MLMWAGKNGNFSIQGGPAWLQPDAGETSVGFSGKANVSAPVAEPLDVYGEVSFAKYDGRDAGLWPQDWHAKYKLLS